MKSFMKIGRQSIQYVRCSLSRIAGDQAGDIEINKLLMFALIGVPLIILLVWIGTQVKKTAETKTIEVNKSSVPAPQSDH